MHNQGEILEGGLMNAPVLLDNQVHRKATKSTETIHQLLKHVRDKGIQWVPEPISFDASSEILGFIQGEVPHAMPEWIWKSDILTEIGEYMRAWHDATVDFKFASAQWSFDTLTNPEVICHNDFAPYNCVFQDHKFVGLIDFDLCAPGSRLWDMAYTAYRFIPLMPPTALAPGEEASPFDIETINSRLNLFLKAYAKGQPEYAYTPTELLEQVAKRLLVIAEWTSQYGKETKNDALLKNAIMYEAHSKWITNGGLNA